MDIVEEIKDLQRKKDEAQTLLTKYKTQLEGIVEDREKLIAELKEKFGVTPEEAEARLEQLVKKRDELLEKAKESLSKIKV